MGGNIELYNITPSTSSLFAVPVVSGSAAEAALYFAILIFSCLFFLSRTTIYLYIYISIPNKLLDRLDSSCTIIIFLGSFLKTWSCQSTKLRQSSGSLSLHWLTIDSANQREKWELFLIFFEQSYTKLMNSRIRFILKAYNIKEYIEDIRYLLLVSVFQAPVAIVCAVQK